MHIYKAIVCITHDSFMCDTTISYV